MLQSDKLNLLRGKYRPFAMDEDFSILKRMSGEFLADLVNLGASITGIDLFRLVGSSEVEYICTQEYSGTSYGAYIEAIAFLSSHQYDILSVNFEIFDDYTTEEKVAKMCNIFHCDSNGSISVKRKDCARLLSLCFNLRLHISEKKMIMETSRPIDLDLARRFADLEMSICDCEEMCTLSILM